MVPKASQDRVGPLPPSVLLARRRGRVRAEPQGPSSGGHNVLVQWKDLKLPDKDTAVKDDAAEPRVPRADPRCVIDS